MDDLIANYTTLAEQRGWSMEQMADHVQSGDPTLAAQLREQADVSRDSEPQERTAPEKRDAAPKRPTKKAAADTAAD